MSSSHRAHDYELATARPEGSILLALSMLNMAVSRAGAGGRELWRPG